MEDMPASRDHADEAVHTYMETGEILDAVQEMNRIENRTERRLGYESLKFAVAAIRGVEFDILEQRRARRRRQVHKSKRQ